MTTTLTITTGENSEKSRSFSALLLGYVQADAMLPCEPGKAVKRPAWLCVGSSEDEMRPFIANLRTGRRAESRHDKFELLKTAGYAFSTQRTSVGTIATAFLPDLFRIDPGMVDPTGIRFIAMPPRSWLEGQKNSFRDEMAGAIRHVSRLMNSKEWLDHMGGEDIVPMSTLFCAYLDRRTRCPLVPDLAFQLQLYVAMMREELAESMSKSSYDMIRGDVNEKLGYAKAVACCVKHERFEAFLAEQVGIYMGAKR